MYVIHKKSEDRTIEYKGHHTFNYYEEAQFYLTKFLGGDSSYEITEIVRNGNDGFMRYFNK